MVAKNKSYMRGRDAILDNENITVYNSNKDTSLHKHDFIELVYFKEGIGTHTINGDELDISSGSLCLINTGVSHSYQINDARKDKEISVKNCIFYPSFLGEEYHSDTFIQDFWKKAFKGEGPVPERNFIQINNDYNRDYATLFNMIEYEIRTKKANYLDVIRNCLECILIRLFRDYLEDTSKPQISPINGELIEKALDYINLHYNEPLTIAQCAKYTGFSSVYFSRLFKAYTKYTFRTYLQRLRCEKACTLLLKTELSIQSICMEVGYSDFKQFYLLFKKYVGMTPKVYRNTIPTHNKEQLGLHNGLKNSTP